MTSTPSRATVAQSQCLLERPSPDASIFAGRAYDGESGVPLGGARVTLSWETDERARSASTYVRTDSDGWFRACDVPSDRPVLAGVDYIGRQSRRRELDGHEGYVEIDPPLYSLFPTHITGTLKDATSGAVSRARLSGFVERRSRRSAMAVATSSSMMCHLAPTCS